MNVDIRQILDSDGTPIAAWRAKLGDHVVVERTIPACLRSLAVVLEEEAVARIGLGQHEQAIGSPSMDEALPVTTSWSPSGARWVGNGEKQKEEAEIGGPPGPVAEGSFVVAIGRGVVGERVGNRIRVSPKSGLTALGIVSTNNPNLGRPIPHPERPGIITLTFDELNDFAGGVDSLVRPVVRAAVDAALEADGYKRPNLRFTAQGQIL